MIEVLSDEDEKKDRKRRIERERSADVGKGFGLFSARIKPVPVAALSVVLNQLQAPPALFISVAVVRSLGSSPSLSLVLPLLPPPVSPL